MNNTNNNTATTMTTHKIYNNQYHHSSSVMFWEEVLPPPPISFFVFDISFSSCVLIVNLVDFVHVVCVFVLSSSFLHHAKSQKKQQA